MGASNAAPTSSGMPRGSSGTQTVVAALTKAAVVAVDAAERHYEFALALLPRTLSKGGLYEYEGANYPATPAAREALLDQVAWTYAALAAECTTRHPEISLPTPEQMPSEADLAKTLQAVADCSYTDLGIKPYWIPRLLVDVDVCGRKLGKDWRLPTVQDVESLTQAERAAVVATAREGLYNGLEVFAIGANKTLHVSNLETGATRALSETNATYLGDTYHYEGNASLRCVRGELAPLL